ncbi:MAG TPA: hypothetical protein PLA71_00945 [Saccharofermentans sp.]|nr:hypothetical protein [Saccharofermentans sp.]
MTKDQVIARLCNLSTWVGSKIFKEKHAHDCFCSLTPTEHPSFQFEEAIIKYIEKAVTEKTTKGKETLDDALHENILGCFDRAITQLRLHNGNLAKAFKITVAPERPSVCSVTHDIDSRVLIIDGYLRDMTQLMRHIGEIMCKQLAEELEKSDMVPVDEPTLVIKPEESMYSIRITTSVPCRKKKI